MPHYPGNTAPVDDATGFWMGDAPRLHREPTEAVRRDVGDAGGGRDAFQFAA